MKYAYVEQRFNSASEKKLVLINTIIAEYINAGMRLSVRQLYYQLVARGHIPNTERSYKTIVDLVTKGRMAGRIDWDCIEDRNRDLVSRSSWPNGKSILESAARSFHMDMWEGQEVRPFVVVEKAALAGIVGDACYKHDVPYLAAKGYPSVSVLREFALTRMRSAANAGQVVVLIHLGDHDPSGIDMTRDLDDRLNTFLTTHSGATVEIRRIALNMDQIEELNPPPNPAKTTDSRFESYMAKYGDESWELDALEPKYLRNLIDETIAAYKDEDRWAKRNRRIEQVRKKLRNIAENFKS
jgi:hypothetical protein